MTALLLALLLAVNVQGTDERALLRLEDDWASALVKRERVTFERLLADGFVYTENDQIMDRRAVLNSVVGGSDTVAAARNDSMVVHRFGPSQTRGRSAGDGGRSSRRRITSRHEARRRSSGRARGSRHSARAADRGAR